MQKLDFTSVLDSFGIPITLLVKPEKEGTYVHGEWFQTPYESWEKRELNDPVIPSSLITQLPMQAKYGDGGRYEEYDLIWFSSEQVPIKSRILKENRVYSVESITPYTDYSDVTQYGLKAVQGHD